jgi:protein SCO1/2
VPEFSFTTQEGRTFTLSGMKGKINVMDFIFTSCPGICPVMSARMSELYQAFHSTDKVQFVSISVDPDRDSLETLKRYAGRYGVHDQRWIFLRAEMPQITDLYENGFKLSGMLPAEHSAKLILVDGKGIIRGYYDSQDEISMRILQTHISALAGEMK